MKHFFLAPLITVLSFAACFAPANDTAKTPPNIVMIISDDQAWTDYSFMGHPQIKTPNIDRLAAQSLTFTHGYVPSSLCCPSLASIVSGRYPHQHKVTSNDPPVPTGERPRDSAAFRDGREIMNRHLEAVPTLPRLLAQNGYVSFQSGKWWQGDYSRGGFTQGMTHGERHGDAGLDIGRKTMQPVFDFMAAARKDAKPFLVWYAPMMPHEPHNPPARLLDKYKGLTPWLPVAKYWAMIEWFDETVGELLAELDKSGLAENTIVTYLSDNGWIQNLKTGGYAPKSKQSPYDGGLRTPIMVRWPGHVEPQKSDALAVERGDPYQAQCIATAKILAGTLRIAPADYLVTFQSRFGAAEWLQPYTEPTLVELARHGARRVDVVCPGFVSDCLETLEEIAMEAKHAFLAAGGQEFHALPCLNESPEWIAALARISRATCARAAAGIGNSP